MTGEGVVVKAWGHKALVRIERQSACSGDCSSCGLCENPTFETEVENPVGAEEGDRVKLYIPTKKVYTSVFLVYLLPVLVLMAIVGICSLLETGSMVMIILLLLSAAVWLFSIKRYNKVADLKSEISEIIS